MQHSRQSITLVCFLAVLLSCSACKKDDESAVPKPLPADKAPSSIREAYASSTGETRQMADDAVMYLDQTDYPKALLVLQQLLMQIDLTPDQRRLTTQAMLTAGKQVSEAADKGDEKAIKLLRQRSAYK